MVFAGDVIQLVQANPALYDISHPDYRNPSVKDELWKEIGERLNHPGELQ